ncbi:unnamed protein product [[Candida] boidinii]|uniref:Unnamed protein product n=1 Tax=Candida boidinii TaxID=5477 RepID=A0A9W6SW52_CANBO|nr:hypothetical protein B5S30_g2578 [[Candida] boidinii]GME68272.1 unnamed protein product [[Candida] boidinii]GMF59934.1 unnamed protein product [[Candida] boidinii]GMF99727.1 unnamed protein product [[Candida] boidinii]
MSARDYFDSNINKNKVYSPPSQPAQKNYYDLNYNNSDTNSHNSPQNKGLNSFIIDGFIGYQIKKNDKKYNLNQYSKNKKKKSRKSSLSNVITGAFTSVVSSKKHKHENEDNEGSDYDYGSRDPYDSVFGKR